MKDIGKRIKEARINKKLKQSELALKISVDNSQFSKIENGKILPTISQLVEISSILNVSIDWLLVGENRTDSLFSTEKRFENSLDDFISANKEVTDLLSLNLRSAQEINALLTEKVERLEAEIIQLKKELESENASGYMRATKSTK